MKKVFIIGAIAVILLLLLRRKASATTKKAPSISNNFINVNSVSGLATTKAVAAPAATPAKTKASGLAGATTVSLNSVINRSAATQSATAAPGSSLKAGTTSLSLSVAPPDMVNAINILLTRLPDNNIDKYNLSQSPKNSDTLKNSLLVWASKINGQLNVIKGVSILDFNNLATQINAVYADASKLPYGQKSYTDIANDFVYWDAITRQTIVLERIVQVNMVLFIRGEVTQAGQFTNKFKGSGDAVFALRSTSEWYNYTTNGVYDLNKGLPFLNYARQQAALMATQAGPDGSEGTLAGYEKSALDYLNQIRLRIAPTAAESAAVDAAYNQQVQTALTIAKIVFSFL